MKQTKFHKNNYITYIHHSSVCILKVPLKDLANITEENGFLEETRIEFEV